jgi:alkylation response protein AidB-like acyl-CoA dehydrogenase
MDLKLSADEQQLQDDLRGWLDTHYDFSAHLARTGSAESRDSRLWQGLVENGWIARALPRRGDMQQSTVDAAIIAEEFGRAVVVEPFIRSALLAAHVINEAVSPELADELLGQIGRGEHRFACALSEPDGRFRLDWIETRAESAGNGWTLTGRKSVVADGADADRVLVSARTPEGETGLFLITSEGDGTTRTPFHSIDDFAQADLSLENAQAIAIAIGDHVPAAIAAAVDRVIVAVGAEAVGAAQAALDETAAYASRRQQFGRPIAQFQVIAHRLARMFIELEALRGGVIEALSVADGSAEERALAASGLKLLLAENGRFVVNQGIQVHGGYGTLIDYKVSHCFKRVFALETLFGNGDYHLERYATAFA